VRGCRRGRRRLGQRGNRGPALRGLTHDAVSPTRAGGVSSLPQRPGVRPHGSVDSAWAHITRESHARRHSFASRAGWPKRLIHPRRAAIADALRYSGRGRRRTFRSIPIGAWLVVGRPDLIGQGRCAPDRRCRGTGHGGHDAPVDSSTVVVNTLNDDGPAAISAMRGRHCVDQTR